MQTGEIIGLTASAISAFTFVPQVYKAWRTKSVEDLSNATIWTVTISTFLWLMYGVLNDPLLWPVILCNSFVFVLSFVLHYFKRTYKK